MYRIGRFSELGRVTIKTLRHYDEVGLLVPEYVDAQTGYRYYTTKQLFDLHKIVALRQIGFGINDITEIIHGQDNDVILNKCKAQLEEESRILTDRLFRLNHYINSYKEDNFMNYQAVIKEIPACIVFSSRQIIPSYEALLKIVPEVGKKVTRANPGLQCALPEYCFNIYHDGEFKENDMDVEICEAVTQMGKDGDGIIFKEMPAVTVVCVMHKGAYEDLGAAYAYAFKWVEENGYTVTDKPRESYIDGIWNKDDKSEWLTELQIPIKK